MKREWLVILDYSGTLSMDAALFSRPGNLIATFEKCGLADLGVVTPEIFWTEIVNPTWEEGSTTRVGYAEIMKRAIREGLNSDVSDTAIDRAVASFVAAYFENSAIHPRWQPVLERLSRDEAVCCVIATDHYAEATGYIVGHLKALGIPAVPVDPFDTVVSGHLYIANSADLGVHKANLRFWEVLKNVLSLEGIKEVVIVDDFGFNETSGDAYAVLAKVDKRKAFTEALLKDAFSVPVHTVSFMIEELLGERESYDRERTVADHILRVSTVITDRLWPSV